MKAIFRFAMVALAAGSVGLAAESAALPAAASPAVTDNFTLTAEGAIPLDVTFKIITTSAGRKITAEGPISYAGVDDGRLQFQGTLTEVKNGCRLDYTIIIRVPIVAKFSVPGAASVAPTSTTEMRTFTTKASAILQLGQPLVVANTDGKTITMTLAKAAAK